MAFKTFEELQAHNNSTFENSPFGQLQIQSETATNINGLSYFERITLNSQPHKVFKLDWSTYGSLDFADTFLPYIKEGFKATGMWMFDGAELFSDIRTSEKKILSLTNEKKIINLLSFSYPKGVLAEKRKETVSVGKHEICTFIEIDKQNSIEIFFKFGNNFKDFLNSNSVDKLYDLTV